MPVDIPEIDQVILERIQFAPCQRLCLSHSSRLLKLDNDPPHTSECPSNRLEKKHEVAAVSSVFPANHL